MYTPVTLQDFASVVEKVKAVPVQLDGTNEVVYEFPIVTKSGKEFPESVRIYTSIDHRDLFSRTVGMDAIRVCLVRNGRVLKSAKRVNRTGKVDDMMERVVDRCRQAIRYAINPENRGSSGYLFTKNREFV